MEVADALYGVGMEGVAESSRCHDS
jgi:hypothetical protein